MRALRTAAPDQIPHVPRTGGIEAEVGSPNNTGAHGAGPGDGHALLETLQSFPARSSARSLGRRRAALRQPSAFGSACHAGALVAVEADGGRSHSPGASVSAPRPSSHAGSACELDVIERDAAPRWQDTSPRASASSWSCRRHLAEKPHYFAGAHGQRTSRTATRSSKTRVSCRATSTAACPP